MKTAFPYITAILLAAFGLLTLFLSASVIFDLFGIREREGNYVLFIVWSNFIGSILYLISAYGLIRKMNYTPKLLGVSALILIAAFIALMAHINSGGLHEAMQLGTDFRNCINFGHRKCRIVACIATVLGKRLQ